MKRFTHIIGKLRGVYFRRHDQHAPYYSWHEMWSIFWELIRVYAYTTSYKRWTPPLLYTWTITLMREHSGFV